METRQRNRKRVKSEKRKIGKMGKKRFQKGKNPLNIEEKNKKDSISCDFGCPFFSDFKRVSGFLRKGAFLSEAFSQDFPCEYIL